MSGRVLVTGAAGFIGAHVVRACRAADQPVTAVDLRGCSFPDDEAVEVMRGDASDLALLKRIRAGEFMAVLHQAAISDTLEQRWDLLEEANIAVPLRLARVCAESGTRYIYASSSSVYGVINLRQPVSEDAAEDRSRCSGPLNLYARSKLLLDNEMKSLGPDLAWVGLRYTNVFGTGEGHKGRMASIISQLVRSTAEDGRIELFSDTLEAERDYVPIGHVTDTIQRLLRSQVRSGVYNLGAGHAIPFATLARWCADLRDDRSVEVKLTPNPISDSYQYWTCADMTALRSELPDIARLNPEDIRRAATDLYEAFSRPCVAGTWSPRRRL